MPEKPNDLNYNSNTNHRNDNDSNIDLWAIDDEDMLASEDGIQADTYDLDSDGTDDAVILSIDSDNDGAEDEVVTAVDTNDDGQVDFIVHAADLDSDGQADVVVYEADLNYDGTVDYTEVHAASDDNDMGGFFFRAADLDFDGDIDTVAVGRDEEHTVEFGNDSEDSDSYEETEAEPSDNEYDESVMNEDHPYNEELDLDSNDGDDSESDDENTDDDDYEDDDYDDDALEIPTVDYDPDADNATRYYELENYDPDSDESENVIGDPEEAMDLWEFQGDTNRCAVYSQKFIIEEYTGEEVDIEELVDNAEENGWFSESGGTPVIYMDKLLDHYGVPNEASSGNDIDDLAESLSEGKRVIVAVDADEIWFGENDSRDVYTPNDAVNHAVEVIGINNSDPDNPTVILNDPGHPNGGGIEVPLETFLDAWEDGDCYMVECM